MSTRPDLTGMTNAELDVLMAEIEHQQDAKSEHIMECSGCSRFTADELLGVVNEYRALYYLLVFGEN